MTDAIALLKLALALLVAAQQPNVPADLRQAAVNLASSAITQAIQEEVRLQVASSTSAAVTPKAGACESKDNNGDCSSSASTVTPATAAPKLAPNQWFDEKTGCLVTHDMKTGDFYHDCGG